MKTLQQLRKEARRPAPFGFSDVLNIIGGLIIIALIFYVWALAIVVFEYPRTESVTQENI